MKYYALHRIVFLLLASILISACSFSLAEDIPPPAGADQMSVVQEQAQTTNGPLYPLVPPSPADGELIYADKCSPCHGVSGQGDGPQAAQLPNPVSAVGSADLARQATPADWYTQVTKGNLDRFMPPFGSLSDSQRWDVVAYAFSLSMPAEAVAQGEQLYQANCASCHGEEGEGDGDDAAGLSMPDLTSQAFMAERSTADFFQAISAGVEGGMPAYGDQLSEEERWAISSFLRQLTFAAPDQAVADQVTPVPTGEASAQPAETSQPETPAAEASQVLGRITGEVVNASGGGVPEDLVLTLHGFDNMQMAITQTTTVNSDGSFVFEDVEMPVGRAFIIVTDYANTSYTSDIGRVEAGISTLNLPVQIYDTTSDASILKADRLHLFFDFLDPKTLRVVQLYVISNPTDKTLVPAGEGEPTARFVLPEGATNLEFQDGALGERYIQTADGFGDSVAIPPGAGSYEVLYAYNMPYNRKLELVQPVTLPVDAVVVLVPEDGIKIKGGGLQDGGTRDVQGAQYRVYNGESLANGDTLQMTISGRPSSGQPTLSSSSNTNLLIGLGVFGVALVLTGVWLYSRRRATGAEEESDEEPAFVGEVDSAESLMDAIIALDDLYQAGQLPEEAYLQRRAELKARLQALNNR